MNDREKVANRQLYYLAFISLLVLILIGFMLPPLPSSPMMKDAFWADKVLKKDKYDIVVAGDSRVYRGINPGVIDSLLPGMQTFNFGFSSAGLSEDYILHSVNLLKPEGAGVLIFGISPNSFLPSSLKNEHFNSLISRKNMDLLIKRDLYPHIKCLDRRTFSDFYKYMKGESYFELFHPESGYVSSDKFPVDQSSAVNAYKKQFQNERPVSLRSFFRCISGLKNKGLKVILIRIPIGYEMKQLEDELCSQFFNELENTCKTSGFPYYDYSEFSAETYDGSHLSSLSSDNFTLYFGQMLRPKINPTNSINY